MQGAPASLSRTITVAPLVVVATAMWVFLFRSEAVMRTMEGEGVLYHFAVAMMDPSAIAPYFAASVVMWTAMMVAMMIPAALPLVAVFSRLDRRSHERAAHADTGLFAGGYLAIWSRSASRRRWCSGCCTALGYSKATCSRCRPGPVRSSSSRRASTSSRLISRRACIIAKIRSRSCSLTGATARSERSEWARSTASTASAAAGC